jgi:uncharacterized repeat protein (TIGR01451 family)
LQVPAVFSGILTSQTNINAATLDPSPICSQCADIDIKQTADIVIVNTDNNSFYTPGLPTVYTVTVTNNGPNDANDLEVSNDFPAGITQFSWTGSNGSSGINIPLIDSIATLANGATVTYIITIQVPTFFTGDLISQTSATSATFDPNNNCSQCIDIDTKATSGADILTQISDASLTYTAGNTANYTVTVQNFGPDIATNVQVSGGIPNGITATNVTWTGSNGTSGTGSLSNTLPSLAIGQIITYQIAVPVPSDYNQTTNLVNQVVVTSPTADPNPSCSGCTDIDTPSPQANLVTVKADIGTTFDINKDIVYTITITNNGPSNAVNVVVSDPIPNLGIGTGSMTWSSSLGASGSGSLLDNVSNQ